MWDIEEDLFENGELKYEKPNDNELKTSLILSINTKISQFYNSLFCWNFWSGAVATFLYDKFLSEIDKEQFRRKTNT